MSIFLTSTEVSLFLNSIWKRIQEFHPKIRTDDEREQRLSYYIMSKLSVKKNANKHFPLGQTIDFGTWRKKSCETGKRNANQLNFLFILGISWLDQIQTPLMHLYRNEGTKIGSENRRTDRRTDGHANISLQF